MAEAALPEQSTRIEHLFVPAEVLPHADGSRSRADPLLSPTGQRENSTTQERPASRCLFSTCFKLIIGYTLVINFNSFEIFSCLSQRGKSKKMAVKCSIIKRDKVYYFHFQKIDGKYTQRAIKNVDTLSKRKNGISSSYPDLLDPSFGSCLRGESPKEGKKNGGRTQNRTGDTGIFSPLLYRLSYPATCMVYNGHPFFIFSSLVSDFFATFQRFR